MRLYPSNVIDVLNALPPTQAVLIRGPHGIGKSQIGGALGKLSGRQVIDRRLAQMSEGDFTGLPKLYDHTYDANGAIIKFGHTEFMPPEWFVSACEKPSVLFLDELNRATPELQQCAFELVLDRTLQGRRIHPDTIVIAAVNCTGNSSMYQVTDLDPALLDRFLVLDMIPSINDWKSWALEKGLHRTLIDFCVENQGHWWFDPSNGNGLEPNKVYPTPRAWHMLDTTLRHAGLYNNVQAHILTHIAVGLVGTEAGVAFSTFIRDTTRMISAEDVLNKYDAKTSIAKRVKEGAVSAEQQLQIIERLVDHHKSNAWNETQVNRVRSFFDDIVNAEIFFAFWTKISAPVPHDISIDDRKRRMANQQLVHRSMRNLILAAATSGHHVKAQ